MAKFTPAEKEIGSADAAKRKAMPAAWFLQPDQRKYPSHDATGQLSKTLLIHAEERATQNGHSDIASKARDLLKQHFPDNASGNGAAGDGATGNGAPADPDTLADGGSKDDPDKLANGAKQSAADDNGDNDKPTAKPADKSADTRAKTSSGKPRRHHFL